MTIAGAIWLSISVFIAAAATFAPLIIELDRLPNQEDEHDE